MKAYKLLNALLLCMWLITSSCTRKAFFTKDCNVQKIPAYKNTNPDWTVLNEKILQEFRKCFTKPKIIDGARGVVIYRSLPKHQQSVEQMICEFWKSN